MCAQEAALEEWKDGEATVIVRTEQTGAQNNGRSGGGLSEKAGGGASSRGAVVEAATKVRRSSGAGHSDGSPIAASADNLACCGGTGAPAGR
jgi:hypothetical protein